MMDRNQHENRIVALAALLRAQIPKAENPADAALAETFALGIEIVGEFLMDLKRMADAADLANRIQAQRFDFVDPKEAGP